MRERAKLRKITLYIHVVYQSTGFWGRIWSQNLFAHTRRARAWAKSYKKTFSVFGVKDPNLYI